MAILIKIGTLFRSSFYKFICIKWLQAPAFFETRDHCLFLRQVYIFSSIPFLDSPVTNFPNRHSSIYEKPVSYASLSSLPPTPQTGTSSSPAANEQDFYDSNSITVPDESTAVGIMVEMKPNSRPTSWFCNISIPFSTTCGELIDELGARIVAAHPRVPHGILWTIRIRVVWNQWQLKPNIIKQMEGKQNFNYFNNLHQQVKDPRIWEKVRRFATLTNLDEDEYKQILIEMSRNDYEEKRLLVDYRMTGFKNNRIVLERDFEGKIRKSTYTLQVELLHGAWINRTQQLIF